MPDTSKVILSAEYGQPTPRVYYSTAGGLQRLHVDTPVDVYPGIGNGLRIDLPEGYRLLDFATLSPWEYIQPIVYRTSDGPTTMGIYVAKVLKVTRLYAPLMYRTPVELAAAALWEFYEYRASLLEKREVG